jgi:nitronate monooxygenase
MDFGGEKTKAWKDIWGCGQGIGAISKIQTTAEYVAQLKREYVAARDRLLAMKYA